ASPAETAWESGPARDARRAHRRAARADATENRETRAPARRGGAPRPARWTSPGRRTTPPPPRAAAPVRGALLRRQRPAPPRRPARGDRAGWPAAPCRETDSAASPRHARRARARWFRERGGAFPPPRRGRARTAGTRRAGAAAGPTHGPRHRRR